MIDEAKQVGDEDEGPVSETLADVEAESDALAPGAAAEDAAAPAVEETLAGPGEDAGLPVMDVLFPEPAAAGLAETTPETDVETMGGTPMPPDDSAAVRTTDDIRDDELAIEVLTKADKSEHRIGWVQWGESIFCRPFSYSGPDFLCKDLDEAARIVPVFGD